MAYCVAALDLDPFRRPAMSQVTNSKWDAVLTALFGFQRFGQHSYAGQHDSGSFHPEARAFQRALNVVGCKTHCIRIVQYASEEIPRGEGGLLACIVDHEIVHKDQTTRRQRIKRAAGKDGDIVCSNRAPHIGHQDNVVTFWPIDRDCVSSQVSNAIRQS
jgi:hypothetical protein